MTAQGTGLDTNFDWKVDGVHRNALLNRPDAITVILRPNHDPYVEVTVTSTCDGSVLSIAGFIYGIFPNCRPAAPGPVAMFPNPATNALDFAPVAGQPEAGEYAVSLYDGQGALRWQGRSAGGKLHVDCAALPRGLYGVVITQGDTIVRRNLSLE